MNGLIKYWPIMLSLMAGTVAVGEARIRLAHAEAEVSAVQTHIRGMEARHTRQMEKVQAEFRDDIKGLRDAVGVLQLNVARICVATGADCKE